MRPDLDQTGYRHDVFRRRDLSFRPGYQHFQPHLQSLRDLRQSGSQHRYRDNGYALPDHTLATGTSLSTIGSINSLGATSVYGVVTTNPVRSTRATAPAITGQPSNQTVNVTQAGTFSVAASGTAPLTYQWSKNGAAVSGATSATYTTPATSNTDNGASFSVAVGNTAGTATSNAAILTVTPAAIAPAITSQPVSQTVNDGQTAMVSVAATGTAPLTYQWSKNGAAVSGATSAAYTTPATSNTDNGTSFSVTVGNTAGTATSNAAILTVTPAAIAPAITSQPVGQTVNAGQTATFSVAATGTAPLTYQWSKNGAAVSGATAATYTTPATSGDTDFGTTFQLSR